MIRLYICCHKASFVSQHPLLFPIQVGAAFTNKKYEGFIHDDTGDQISLKNSSYCELTAQYWAWKNDNSDFIGFFHYRRYLYPDPLMLLPYKIENMPYAVLLQHLGYDNFAEYILQYDLIAPIGENMYCSVRQHYKTAPFHHIEDLELAVEILLKLHPEYTEAANKYLSGTVCYFGNIYIMRREIFEGYCAWLFQILEEFDGIKDSHTYSAQEKRVDGYLAERLFGIFYTYQKALGVIHMAELPRVHFIGMDGKLDYGKRISYHLLPPGSKRRAAVKRLFRRNDW